ncbi:MAG: T9SS type B sorting domain-containing protein [Bacteroidia bacterium]|nr:T9SS type B sorting domain-containing protein [Bacteroidia bacterium]
MLALLFIIPMVFGSTKAEATHVMGADITYKCIDTLKFKITVKYYRWCNGVSFSNPSSATRIRCATGGSVNVSLTLDNIKEITPVCATASGECVPANTWGTGEGIEQHTYTATIDFNTTPFSALANCCNIIIETGQCCRNSNINTGAANANFYTYAELNLCKAPCNSSPALTSEPIAILCCNQPFFFNNGASDTADFDSLSYSWASPLSAWNTNIGYSGTWYAFNHPFQAYYPGTLTPPYVNTNASPPIGISIDPETGDIILTPTRCDEVTVAVIEVKEWRKDSTGSYELIGRTRRDMQFITKTCPDNNPPIVNGPYTYSVCAGNQLCFNVTTNDVVFQPPPPATAPPPDTVKNTWNRGIPGATYTIINPTARLQTGQFCWTPGIDQASDLPYTFTVTARDNACPLNAVSVRSFKVTVKHRAQAERLIDTLPCGEYAFESDPIDGFRGTASYRWEILDSNRNLVLNKKIARFQSTGTFLSLKQQDTILFRRGGKYIIQHTINNSPQNCPTTYYDTLVVPPLLEANLSLGKDTFICAGTNLRLEPYISNATPPLTYQWSTMGVLDDGTFVNNGSSGIGDTLTYFDLVVSQVQYDTAVSIIITDGIGCTSSDTVQVYLKANPKAVLPPDPRICTYDSVLIVPNLDTAYWVDQLNGDTLKQGDTLWKEWFYDGNLITFSTDDSVTIHKRGEYVLRVYDSLGCADTDTLYLNVNDTVTADAGMDQELCLNDTIFLEANGLDTFGTGKSGVYIWYNITNIPRTGLGSATNLEFVAINDVEYQLDLSINEGGVTCYDSDSVFVKVNQLPVINIRGDKDICCDYGNITLNFDIISPAGGSWSCTKYPFLVSNNTYYTDSACGLINAPDKFVNTEVTYTYQEPTTGCINSDSLNILVNALPALLLEPKVFCQDINEFRLKDEIVLSPATFLGSPSWECLDCNGNDFSNMLVDKLNVGGLTDYWLDISESTYTLENPDKDTIVLEFSYTSEKGCKSKDTVSIEIWKVPKIIFSSMRDLCWDEGEISLNDLTTINLLDGTWSVIDTTASLGYEPGADLGGITGDTINTTNSVETRPNTKQWLIRYFHDATGCPVSNDTILTIHPIPTVTLTDLDRQPPRYCEVDPDITLGANPSNGVWSSSDPSALVGTNTFSPQNATVKGSDIWFIYDYTNPATGCSNSDSLFAIVEPKPSISLPADTAFCRPLGQMQTSLNFAFDAQNYSSLFMFPVGPNASRASLSGVVPTLNVGLTHQNDSSEVYTMFVQAEPNGSCQSESDVFTITVHPRPDAYITPSDPNGCNPVTSDFNVTFNNNIDPVTAQYNWNLGDGNTSSIASPTSTYSNDGTTQISLVVTSAEGCDTTLTSSIDVYPLPVANFVPNPNNYTTAALPRFTFANQSTVSSVLGSTLENHYWDFGDPFINDDTSTLTDPSWFYSNDTAEYIVKLVVETNYGCRDSFTYPVVVGPDLIVFIPNAFTPETSGPEENETFGPIISGEKHMELIIFNRWGEIVYETIKKDEQWDGNYKGVPAQQDVYAYTLKVTALNDEVYTYTGTITLIR